jgi:sterol desaturase/sphingolipid hydroxylase (fatty acid hydroxylase superfamily)
LLGSGTEGKVTIAEFWRDVVFNVVGGGSVIGPIALIIGFALETALRRGRPQRGGQTAMNIGLMMFYNIVRWVLTPALFFWTAHILQALGGGLIYIANPWLAFVVILVADDFTSYWEHRAAHKWLWAFHSIHHSDPAINASTANRLHWVEGQFARLVRTTPMMLLFSAPPEAFLALVMLRSVVNTWAHLDVRVHLGWLSVILTGPQLHRIHHSRMAQHYDRNFAQMLPIWDVLFGTYHAPAPDEFPATGVGGVEPPKSLLHMVIWPLGTKLTWTGRLALSEAKAQSGS